MLAESLGLLQLAFTIWMIVDAYNRGAESFWYWVIFIFQPIGPWAYFFAVKFRHFRFRGVRPTAPRDRKMSLDELRYRVERTPTVATRFALAERLMEKGQHAEAIPQLEAVLAFEPDYCAGLHALAECKVILGTPDDAIAPLEKLINREDRWQNYRARRTLIDVHDARGKSADTLAACREYTKRMPNLENKCLLAECLMENNLPSEAAQVLDQALQDLDYAPWMDRLRSWRWAREAKRMLAEAEASEEKMDGAKAG
ncbi:MAG: tetratricopeptide repeat protein [Gemmataceae bacterium]